MKIPVTVAVLLLPFLTVFSAPAEKTVAAAQGVIASGAWTPEAEVKGETPFTYCYSWGVLELIRPKKR